MPTDISQHILALGDPEDSIRTRAMDALVAIGEPAIPALMETLKGKEGTAGWCATTALGRIGKPAVPPLLDALKAPQTHVRENAISALRAIEDPRAIPPLIEILKDRYLVRASAVLALEKFGDSRAVPALIELRPASITEPTGSEELLRAAHPGDNTPPPQNICAPQNLPQTKSPKTCPLKPRFRRK